MSGGHHPDRNCSPPKASVLTGPWGVFFLTFFWGRQVRCRQLRPFNPGHASIILNQCHHSITSMKLPFCPSSRQTHRTNPDTKFLIFVDPEQQFGLFAAMITWKAHLYRLVLSSNCFNSFSSQPKQTGRTPFFCSLARACSPFSFHSNAQNAENLSERFHKFLQCPANLMGRVFLQEMQAIDRDFALVRPR